MFRLLVGMCGAETETLAVVRGFTFFTGMSKASKTFCIVFIYKMFIFPIFSEFLEYEKYGECSDYYKLFGLRQILFLMHCFARFDEIVDFISGISHSEVIIQ